MSRRARILIGGSPTGHERARLPGRGQVAARRQGPFWPAGHQGFSGPCWFSNPRFCRAHL